LHHAIRAAESEVGLNTTSNATARINTGLRSAELYLRRELRRHFLSERERLVADALLEVSLGWGLETVQIPKLDVLGQLVGLARPHVHGALRSLFNMKILRIGSVDGIASYSFQTDTEKWKVKIRASREQVKMAKDLLREVNHVSGPEDTLSQLARTLAKPSSHNHNSDMDAPPHGLDGNFKDQDHALFLPAGVTNYGTVTDDQFPELS
jgi:hypothetical protein